MNGLCEDWTPDEIYDRRRWQRAAGETEPPIWVPLHQGDVFEGVVIPGYSDSPQIAMLFMHPCTMRAGATLASHLTVVPIELKSETKVLEAPKWAKEYKVMPLPALLSEQSSHYGNFMRMATVPSEPFNDRTRRVATLSPLGRQLMRQRIIFHLTRHAPSIEELEESTHLVDHEAQLLSNWCEEACDATSNWDLQTVLDAEAAFNEFLGTSDRRQRLAAISTAHLVAAEVTRQQRDLYRPK